MTENLKQKSPYEDEVDLREIVKLIFHYKKILISTILFFAMASVIYLFSLKPEFKSSALLEIGHLEMPNGTHKIIEKVPEIISNMKVYHFLNFEDEKSEISFEAIENKLILIEIISRSFEQTENMMNEMIRFIDERHSNIQLLSDKQKKDEISFQIEVIESDISFNKAKELNENQSKKLEIKNTLRDINSKISFIKAKELSKVEDGIVKLVNELPIIDLEISNLEKIIIEDTENLSLLSEANNLLEISANRTLNPTIFNYKNKLSDLNFKKNTYDLELKSLNKKLKLLENDKLQSDQLFSLEKEKATLENKLLMLENDKLQSDQLFSLEKEKATLENKLQTLMNLTQMNTRLIGNLETDRVKPKIALIIMLSLIIGFITGVLLVFIRNFVKSYKEGQA